MSLITFFTLSNFVTAVAYHINTINSVFFLISFAPVF